MPRPSFILLILLAGEIVPAKMIRAGTTTVRVDDLQARTFTDAGGRTLPYRLFVPRDYDPTKKYPLVLFLHGAGGRGTDNRQQITDQPAALVFVAAENQARWPAFFVAPQCPPGEQWVGMPWGAPSGKGKRPRAATWPLDAAVALVDRLAAEFPGVDTARLYVTGFSMGGYGTFDAAVRHPGKWRAAVSICGGYDETEIGPIVELPLWAFHAEDDPTVPVARSRDIIAALRARGGHPHYTEYPASARYGHFSWKPAYADPTLLPWMFGLSAVRAPPDAAAAGGAAVATAQPTASSAPSPARRRGCACQAAPSSGRGDALAAAVAIVLGAFAVRRRRA